LKNRIHIYLCVIVTGVEMSALFTWSYFRDPIAQLFPSWTQSQLSFVFSLHNVTVVVFALVTGVILKYVSPRLVLFVSAVMLAIGFGLMPFLPTDDPEKAYVMLIVCFSMVAASASGFSGISAPTVYQPWVPDQLGLLTGVLFLTAGAAPMLLGFIASLLIPKIGVLAAMRVVGLICFVLIAATMPFNKPPGPDVKLPPPRSAEKTAAPARDFTPKEVLKSPIFWFFFLYSVVARGAGIILSDLGGTIALAFGTAALLGLLVALANGIASVAFGAVHDRYGLNLTLYVGSGLLLVSGVLLLLGDFVGLAPVIIVGLFVGGAGYGISLVMGATGTRVLFGDKSYAQNYSFMTVSIALAAACGYAAGAVLDSMEGRYTGVFFLILLLGVLSFVFTALLARSRKT